MNKEKILTIIDNPILKRISEAMYTIAFCLYFYTIVANDYFKPFNESELKGVLVLVLPVIVITQWVTHRDRKRDIAIGAVLIVFFKIVETMGLCQFDAALFPLFIAGSVGADYKKVLRICAVIWGVVICETIIATFASGEGNTVYAETARIRSSAGLGYVNTAASFCLFFCLYIFLTSEYGTDYIAFIFATLSALASRFYFDSNTSELMSILLCVFIIYSRIEVYFWKKKAVKIISAVINVLSLLFIPLSTVFIIIAAVLYGNGSNLMAKLNKALHSRVGLTWNGLSEYGVTAFGQDIKMIGASAQGMKAVNYNYLDSSYINILVRYGWGIAIIIWFIWTFIVFKAMNGRRRRFVFVALIIAIHSWEEIYFFELAYNPILWMPFAYGVNRQFAKHEAKARNKMRQKENLYPLIVATAARIAVALLLIPFMPGAFMRFRTLFDIRANLAVQSSLVDSRYLACIFMAALFVFIIAAGTIAKRIYVEKTVKIPYRSYIVAGGALLTALIVFIISGALISSKSEAYASRIEADRAAIEIVTEAAEYPVYADEFPEVYRREFKGIKKSFLTGADLVRKLDCTIITDADDNVVQFFSRGMLFCQISDESAVYTTDNSVAQALYEAGYHVRGYYYCEEEVAVSGKYTSESIAITPGNNTLTGEISFARDEENEYDNHVAIARIAVASENGEELVKRVLLKDLDENGTYSFNYDFHTNCEQVTVSITTDYAKELMIRDTCITAENATTGVAVPLNTTFVASDVAIYPGKYKLVTTLSLGNIKGAAGNDVVGTFEYTTNADRTGLQTIYAEDFDANGNAQIETTVSSLGEYFEFIYNMNTQYEPRVLSITYQADPDYDIHYTYDKNGYVLKAEYYDIEGNRVANAEGYSAIEYEYDKKGNPTLTRYLDEDDNLMILPSEGYAEIHRVYNDLGYVTYESYYGTDGEPLLQSVGFAAVSYETDSMGRQLVIKYYDIEGNLTNISSGYAEIHREYDDENRVVYEAFYDAEGERYVFAQGYSACRYEYDEIGNRTVIVYLDADDDSVMTTYGYAEVHREFDERNRVVVESYYGTAGEIMVTSAGYATVVKEYDDNNNVIAERYFGIETSDGYTERQREFDTKNRVVYEAMLNSDGEFIIMSGEYAAYRKEYDENGNVSKITYYGTDGNPVMIGGEFAQVQYKYDDSNRVIYEAYFDGDGNAVSRNAGYHGTGYEYDENNNRNVVRYYDINDKLMLLYSQYVEVRRVFDESRRVKSDSYFGLSGEKVTLNDGFHTVTYGYDEAGNTNNYKYYDEDGKPVLTIWGYFEIRKTFNENRQLIREEYYDIDGNPIANTSGVAAFEREYYDDGQVMAEIKYDIDGNVITE